MTDVAEPLPDAPAAEAAGLPCAVTLWDGTQPLTRLAKSGDKTEALLAAVGKTALTHAVRESLTGAVLRSPPWPDVVYVTANQNPAGAPAFSEISTIKDPQAEPLPSPSADLSAPPLYACLTQMAVALAGTQAQLSDVLTALLAAFPSQEAATDKRCSSTVEATGPQGTVLEVLLQGSPMWVSSQHQP